MVPFGTARLFFCLTFKGGGSSPTLELQAHDIQSSISFQAISKLGKPQIHKKSRVLFMYKLNFIDMYVLFYTSIYNVHSKSYFESHVWFGASVPTVQNVVLKSKQSILEFEVTQMNRLTLPTLVNSTLAGCEPLRLRKICQSGR